jgi:plasmid stabilization system protein ParE
MAGTGRQLRREAGKFCLGRDTDKTDFYRLAPVRFPYRIFYRLRGDEVIILRVLHGRSA